MALSKAEIVAKLQIPEWKALLDTIAFCEGGAYNRIYSGVTFSDFSDHPNRTIKGSSASGRYQILSKTWFGKAGANNGLKQRIPLSDFSPNSQDIAAIWLIANDRRVDPTLIEQGAPNQNNFTTIVNKLLCEWRGLPETNSASCRSQSKKTLQAAYNFYVQALAWRKGQGPQPTGFSTEGEGEGAIDTAGATTGFNSPTSSAGAFPLFSGLFNTADDYCAGVKPLTYVDAKSFAGCENRIDISFFNGPLGIGAAANPLVGDTTLNNPSIPNFINIDPNSVSYGEFIVPIEESKYVFTSGVGPRWGRIHNGVDLAAPTGTPSAAIASGVAELARWTTGGYGNLIIIKHDNGYYSLNGHFSKILINEGQRVEQGQVIALVGNTGFSTGPHLHLEIARSRNGNILANRINPASVLNLKPLKTR